MKKKYLISIFLFLIIFIAGKDKNPIFIDSSLLHFPKIHVENDRKVFHIFSHGKPGSLFINGKWLDNQELLNFIKNKTESDTKEVLIYGCEFAKGQAGIEAVQYLEKNLNMKISASTDITGKDGNWLLEYGKSPNTLIVPYNGNLQLDNIHYLNPIIFANYASDIDQEFIYLSTPSVEDISVTMTYASGNGSPRISVTDLSDNSVVIPVTNGIISLSNVHPKRIRFINGTNNVIPPGNTPITIPSTNAGTVISGNNAGLIFKSEDGEFYVNYRGRQLNHAGTMLTKGKAALGTEFWWGGFPIPNSATFILPTDIGNLLSIMATEDDTNIEISNIQPGVKFLNGDAGINSPLTGTAFYRTLKKGESFMLYAPAVVGVTIQNGGWLGAKITSNKNISVVVGEIMMLGNSNAKDFGLEQLVPVNQIGFEYIVMQGAGGNNEKVVVVATENDTNVTINGASVPITTLQAGKYFEIDSSLLPDNYFNADGNIYIKTDKPSYVFHKIYGSSGNATNNLVLVVPLSCFGQNSVDLIPDAHKIGNAIYPNTILSVLSVSGNIPEVTINGNPVSPSQSGGIVTGNSQWESYRYPIGDSNIDAKDVKIVSSGSIQANLLGANANAGFGGYYSGFGTTPVVTISSDSFYSQLCVGKETTLSVLPEILSEIQPTSFQWYKNGQIITGATNDTYTFTPAEKDSKYSLIITVNGGCTISSNALISGDCPCSKPGTKATENESISGTKIGISIRDTNSSNNWPYDVKNGFIALDANNKGFVITRISNPETAISQPVAGMIVYDTIENCIKLYNGETWNCIQQTCNDNN